MPVKNAEKYLTDCLDSILIQSTTDWELMAVNDHSTDLSLVILQKYAHQDQRIKVFSNSGQGIIDALSLAFDKSSGNYITRMDADDIMQPKKLQLLLAALKNNPLGVSTAKVEYFSKNGIGEGYKNYQNWLNNLIDKKNHFEHIYKECVIPSPCWMTSKDIIESLGGFEALEYPEDYDLCFKFYQNKCSVLGVNEVLHRWRDYSSRTSRNDPNYADNTFIPLKVKYFIKLELNNTIPLCIWGAGKKGKAIASILSDQNIGFKWFTNNPNKIGHNISGVILKPIDELDHSEKHQVIVAIADKTANSEIEKLKQHNDHLIYEFC